jgi:hypothetical protein
MARSWKDLSIEQQRKYVFAHPKSKKQIVIPQYLKDEGRAIAKKLNLIYNGYWADAGKHTLTDPTTGTSILAADLDEAKFKLEKEKEKFKTTKMSPFLRSLAAKIHREFIKLAFCY